MNRLGSLLLFLSLVTLTQADELPWAKDYSTALAQAQANGKVVMVDFMTDWCGFCKKLDATTFQDPAVVRQASAFVPVKVDAEKEGAAMAEKYQVSAFPVVVFIDPKLGVVGRIRGYKKPDEWLALVANVLEARRSFEALSAAGTEPNDVSGQLALAKVYAVWTNTDQALAHYGKARDLGATGDPLAEAASAMGDLFVTLMDDEKSLPYYDQAENAATRVELKTHALLESLYAADRAGNKESAKERARRLIALPGCPKTLRMQAEAALQRLGG